MFICEPFHCTFCFMFWIIVLLEDKSPSQSQVFWLQQVFFQNGPVFGLYLPINFNHLPGPCWRKAGPGCCLPSSSGQVKNINRYTSVRQALFDTNLACKIWNKARYVVFLSIDTVSQKVILRYSSVSIFSYTQYTSLLYC